MEMNALAPVDPQTTTGEKNTTKTCFEAFFRNFKSKGFIKKNKNQRPLHSGTRACKKRENF